MVSLQIRKTEKCNGKIIRTILPETGEAEGGVREFISRTTGHEIAVMSSAIFLDKRDPRTGIFFEFV
jgi:hypothetical protein